MVDRERSNNDLEGRGWERELDYEGEEMNTNIIHIECVVKLHVGHVYVSLSYP